MPFSSQEKKRAYEREYANRPEVKARRQATYQKWSEENKEHLLKRGAKRRLEKRASVLVATSRNRAKRRGIQFDLDAFVPAIQERIDKGVCELTGFPFDLSPGRKFNSPSVDRADPSRGYTYDNIRIVLNLVNAALGDWGEDVLRTVMQQWLSKV
jgi:hypothetical protein